MMKDKRYILVDCDMMQNIELLEIFLVLEDSEFVKASSGDESPDKLRDNQNNMMLLFYSLQQSKHLCMV
jgi:hypothetical protein